MSAGKKSWTWQYFLEDKTNHIGVCQQPKGEGICGEKIKNLTGSTQAMAKHLKACWRAWNNFLGLMQTIHKIQPPEALPEQQSANIATMFRETKRRKFEKESQICLAWAQAGWSYRSIELPFVREWAGDRIPLGVYELHVVVGI
jgi:hypothetical protein